jgi:tetratricopeptide (TPR) repeat protein
MAVLYSDQGDYEKALEYYGKALAIRERVLGAEHPDTAKTYNNMAVVYENQGDYKKALEYCSKALAIRERVLGMDHPSTKGTKNLMTQLLKKAN